MFCNSFTKVILISALLLIFPSQKASAWTNANFATGDLTGWTAVTFSGPSVACAPAVTVVGPGPANDLTIAQLNDVPIFLGNNYACELFSGRGDPGSPTRGDWAQVSQSDTVQGGGLSTVSFWFAGVFENYHNAIGDITGDSYLEVDVNVAGANVATLKYNWGYSFSQIVVTGNTNASADPACVASAPVTWGYVPWTNYQINLGSYVGQVATLQATMYECDGSGHYGTGYLSNPNWVASTASQVTLTKAGSPTGTIAPNTPITYTLSYSNPGTSAVVGAEVNDTIPTGTTLVPGSISASPLIPATGQVGSDIIWNIGYLAAGASGTISFQVLPSGCSGTITNVAKETDLSAGNLTSNAVVNDIATCTPTITPTFTFTPTFTITPTYTFTPTPTNTDTITNTPTITYTPTNTFTVTATFTPTNTFTVTPTFTPTCVTYVWPNPYNPKTAVNHTLKISCMNAQSKVSIFTIAGELVQTLDQSDACQFADMWGTSYCWNGRNKQSLPVATGIYLYVVQQGSNVVQRGKFLIIDGG